MKRRDFLKANTLTFGSTALGPVADGQVAAAADRTEPLVGVQIAPVSIFDEGIDRCLDTLKEKASVNALFIYSQTYHAGTTPSNVLGTDYGSRLFQATESGGTRRNGPWSGIRLSRDPSLQTGGAK